MMDPNFLAWVVGRRMEKADGKPQSRGLTWIRTKDFSLSPPVPGNGKFQWLSSYSKRSKGWLRPLFCTYSYPSPVQV